MTAYAVGRSIAARMRRTHQVDRQRASTAPTAIILKWELCEKLVSKAAVACPYANDL